MNSNLRDVLDTILKALQQLLKIFRVDRAICLVIGIIGFALLAYSAYKMIVAHEKLDSTELTLLFGSSGLFTMSAARVIFYFDKSFKLVDDVTRRLIDIGITGNAEGASPSLEPGGKTPE